MLVAIVLVLNILNILANNTQHTGHLKAGSREKISAKLPPAPSFFVFTMGTLAKRVND